MKTILKPCRVPWHVSPSTDGLTLHHVSFDEPQCTVVFGGGRLGDDGLTDDRRVELEFADGRFARVSRKGDDEDIAECGFDVLERFDGPWEDYLSWRTRRWRETGLCPNSGFYVATESPWPASVSKWSGRSTLRHFLLDGQDSYIEILASSFSWREWLWLNPERDQNTNPNDVVAKGAGVE